MKTTTVRPSLVQFAEAARTAAAKAAPEFRFGTSKVFIAALGESRVTKNLLVEAHRAGLLTLSRADLIPAMSQELVAASEATYLNACWHFIDLAA